VDFLKADDENVVPLLKLRLQNSRTLRSAMFGMSYWYCRALCDHTTACAYDTACTRNTAQISHTRPGLQPV